MENIDYKARIERQDIFNSSILFKVVIVSNRNIPSGLYVRTRCLRVGIMLRLLRPQQFQLIKLIFLGEPGAHILPLH